MGCRFFFFFSFLFSLFYFLQILETSNPVSNLSLRFGAASISGDELTSIETTRVKKDESHPSQGESQYQSPPGFGVTIPGFAPVDTRDWSQRGFASSTDPQSTFRPQSEITGQAPGQGQGQPHPLGYPVYMGYPYQFYPNMYAAQTNKMFMYKGPFPPYMPQGVPQQAQNLQQGVPPASSTQTSSRPQTFESNDTFKSFQSLARPSNQIVQGQEFKPQPSQHAAPGQPFFQPYGMSQQTQSGTQGGYPPSNMWS